MQKKLPTSNAYASSKDTYSACGFRGAHLAYIVAPLAISLILGFGAGCAGASRQAGARGAGVRVAGARSVVPASSAPASATSKRHIIRNGSLRLLTKTPRDDARRVAAVAKSLGGFVSRARHREKRSALTLRIPGDKFQLAMAELRKIGELDQISVRGRDVTARVVDLDIRLRTALKVRKRYLELLAKAQTVAEAMPVQKELERVNTQIERLKGKLKLLRDQVALSTIHVELKYPVRPGIIGWVFYGLYKGVKWLFIWD